MAASWGYPTRGALSGSRGPAARVSACASVPRSIAWVSWPAWLPACLFGDACTFVREEHRRAVAAALAGRLVLVLSWLSSSSGSAVLDDRLFCLPE